MLIERIEGMGMGIGMYKMKVVCLICWWLVIVWGIGMREGLDWVL